MSAKLRLVNVERGSITLYSANIEWNGRIVGYVQKRRGAESYYAYAGGKQAARARTLAELPRGPRRGPRRGAVVTVELWTLDGTDEEHAEVIDLFRMALGLAEEAGVVSPETVSSLRSWCNAEWTRINPRAPQVPPEQELLASLRRSPYWVFWEGLEKDEEVRWTGTKYRDLLRRRPHAELHRPGQ